MMIEYVPVTGRVCVARLKLLIVLEVEVSTWPSGLINFTVTPLIVLLVIWTVTFLPGCAAESQLSILPGSAYAHRRRGAAYRSGTAEVGGHIVQGKSHVADMG